MISLVYKDRNDELDSVIMCEDSKVVDLIKQLDGIKDYKILSYTAMDNTTTKKLTELHVKVRNFKDLCKTFEFTTKLSDVERKIIQEMLDAFDEVGNKVL